MIMNIDYDGYDIVNDDTATTIICSLSALNR